MDKALHIQKYQKSKQIQEVNYSKSYRLPYAKISLACWCVICTEPWFGNWIWPQWIALFILLIASINELKGPLNLCLIKSWRGSSAPTDVQAHGSRNFLPCHFFFDIAQQSVLITTLVPGPELGVPGRSFTISLTILWRSKSRGKTI